MGSSYTCTACTASWSEDRDNRGPRPKLCPQCDPEGTERRRKFREQSRKRRERREETGTRLELLETTLARSRRPHDDPPDRQSVCRMVRRLADARGRPATIEALQDLAAESLAWAALLQAEPANLAKDHLRSVA